MTKKTLATVESLNDANRWRFMLNLGARARTDAASRQDIAALAGEANFYHRRLALIAASASADQGIISAALQGPSGRLAALACRLAALHLDDDAIVRLLPEVARGRRKQLVRACAAAGRTAPIDRTIERLSLNDRCEFAAYASPSVAASMLADSDFVDMLSPQDWSRIGRRSPTQAMPLLAERLQADSLPLWPLVGAINTAMQQASASTPAAGLELLRQAGGRMSMWQVNFGPIASRLPAETAALVLADTNEHVPRVEPSILCRVDSATCSALIRRGHISLSARILRRLPPATRQTLYTDGVLEAFRDQAGALPAVYVGLLPHAARAIEAERGWTAPQNQAIPGRRLPYLAFLPFAEAMRLAAAFIAQPDAELRASAGAAVIATTRYEPAHLGDALAFVRNRKNEQDPVRLALIGALARLPPTRWSDADLPQISEIISEALGSRDCSSQTMSMAAQWLIAMAPGRIAFAARELGRVAERLGQVPNVDLSGKVSDAQMTTLTPHLLPLLELWRARDYNGAVLGLLRNFGRRLRASPELMDFVEGLTADKRQGVADGALGLLSSIRATERIRDLVPRLLRSDPSWVMSATVSHHLNTRRQDLLGEFLRPRVYAGRFSTNKAAGLPTFRHHFNRWTLKQQQLYAESLLSIANSSQRSTWELRHCLDALAQMPAIEPTPIERLASLDTKDVALRDMAIATLGRLDDARGMPCLVAALEDERGRVAIYALRRLVLGQQPDQAVTFLRSVPMKKVTVAKEVVRLAGDLEGETARGFLAEISRRDDLHRDVRIAVLRALWSQLEHAETWDIFAAAARASPAAAVATVRIPQDRLSRHSRLRLAQHLALLLGQDNPRVRRETLQRLVDSPVAIGDQELDQRLRDLLATPDEQEARLVAAALVLCSQAQAQAVDDVAGLFAAMAEPRTLQAAVGALIGRQPYNGDRVGPIAERLVDLLIAERKQTGLAMRLAIHALPSPALQAVVDRAADCGALHAGALMEVLAALPQVLGNRRGAEIETLEPIFAAAKDPMVRRIGLAVLAGRAGVVGWSDQAKVRLATYRGDANPLVQEAASLTFPPDSPANRH